MDYMFSSALDKIVFLTDQAEVDFILTDGEQRMLDRKICSDATEKITIFRPTGFNRALFGF